MSNIGNKKIGFETKDGVEFPQSFVLGEGLESLTCHFSHFLPPDGQKEHPFKQVRVKSPQFPNGPVAVYERK